LVRAASERAAALAEQVYAALLERLGVTLSHAAHALPDVLPLAQKVAFDERVLPALQPRLSEDEPAGIRAWLAQECAAMTPGANPLPALRGPLRRLTDASWVEEL
jgi:hypothetical protein